MSTFVNTLVLDAGPLIAESASSLQQKGNVFFTTPGVISELRDEHVRSQLIIWGDGLKVRHPKAASIRRVCDFAKRSGDFSVLSQNDIHIIALAYELASEAGEERLKEFPGQVIDVKAGEMKKKKEKEEERKSKREEALKQDETTTDEKESENSKMADKKKKPRRRGGKRQREKREQLESIEGGSPILETAAAKEEVSLPEVGIPKEEVIVPKEETPYRPLEADVTNEKAEGLPAREESSREDSSREELSREESSREESSRVLEKASDAKVDKETEEAISDSEWITEDNLQDKIIKDSGEQIDQKSTRLKVALATFDFACQNVSLQMGLSLMNASSGLQITRVRNYMYRCHACFKLSPMPKDGTPKHFCPSCGGATLLRCSVSVSLDGKVTPHLKANFEWHKRGDKYSLPSPLSKKTTKKKGNGGYQHANPEDVVLLNEDQKEYQKALKNDQWRRRQNEKAFQEFIGGGSADNIISPFTANVKQTGLRVGRGRYVNSVKRK